MNAYSFTADQIRAMLALLDMANALRPEFERALAQKIAPAIKAVRARRGDHDGGDE
jgi:hypothetical protein